METLSLTCKDIYPIEITYGKHVGDWIVYLPLVGYAQIVPLEVIDELRNAVEGRMYKQKDVVDTILQHLNDPMKKVYYTSKDERGLLNMMILPITSATSTVAIVTLRMDARVRKYLLIKCILLLIISWIPKERLMSV